MVRFIFRKLMYGFLVLLGVITLVFFLFNVLPGDPARMIMGQRTDISSVASINKELGLDRPLLIRYVNYLNDISPVSLFNASNPQSYWYLDTNQSTSSLTLISFSDQVKLVIKKPYLRRSYQSKRQVSEILAEAFPKTALLALVSIFIAIVVGIGLGILCARYKDSWFDSAALFWASFGMSVPSFFAAVIIAWVFAFVLAPYTGLNMFGSLYTVDDYGNGEYLDLKNILLPAITLGIRPIAVVTELTRSSMLDVLSQDYIRTARAKGNPVRRILLRHALRNALNPVITAISGWLASMLAGAVFVEYVFDWKGIGVVIVDALEKFDFPVLMGAILWISVILIFINIFVDIIYGWLDPRVRIK